MKEFKIRCSAIGKIMAGNMGLTEAQEVKFQTLSVKEKLTELQAKELVELQRKKIFPELPKTAKSFCQMWLKEQLYDRQIDFGSKYTEKGNTVEDESIEFIARQLGLSELDIMSGSFLKNYEFFENEFMCGTPDVIQPEYVVDAKNPWNFSTFPLFETELPEEDYYWQAQGYMNLTGKSHYKLIYTLMNTPEMLIESEMRKDCYRNGIPFEEADYQVYYENMTYDKIPDNLRIKIFEIERNDSEILAINERVKECRKYIETVIKQFPQFIQ